MTSAVEYRADAGQLSVLENCWVRQVGRCIIIKFNHLSEINSRPIDGLVLTKLVIGDIQVGKIDAVEGLGVSTKSRRVVEGGVSRDPAGQDDDIECGKISHDQAFLRCRLLQVGRDARAGAVLPHGTQRAGAGEGVEQIHLTVDDGGETADADADALRRRIAEREPHVLATVAIRIERRSGRVRDELGDGPREHRLRVQVRGKGEPDVEAAVRVRPAQLGQILLERGDHRLLALTVDAAESVDLALPVRVWQIFRDDELSERTRAEHGGLVREDQLLADGVGRESPADPETGSEGLRERAEVDDALAFDRAHRSGRLLAEIEQAVRVVFEHQDVVRPRDLEDLEPALPGERDAGRVVECRDRVEEFDVRPALLSLAMCSRRASGISPCSSIGTWSTSA